MSFVLQTMTAVILSGGGYMLHSSYQQLQMKIDKIEERQRHYVDIINYLKWVDDEKKGRTPAPASPGLYPRTFSFIKELPPCVTTATIYSNQKRFGLAFQQSPVQEPATLSALCPQPLPSR
jgi:hypothetical protein